MNNEIINKLKKILNLTQSGNQGERDAALERAMALATKHNIDLAFVKNEQEKKETKEDMIAGSVPSGARSSVCQTYISSILAKFFNVKVIRTGGRNSGINYVFVGRKSEVEFAAYANDFLNSHMMRSWRDYQTSRQIDTKFRTTYFVGFYNGLCTKLEQSKKATEKEAFASLPAGSQEQYGIVLYNEEMIRNKFVENLFPNLGKYVTAKKTVYDGHTTGQAGYKAGQSTNIAAPLKA